MTTAWNQGKNVFNGIASMQPWDFWAQPRSLPLTPTEIDALTSGTASPDLQTKALHLGQLAQNQLMNAEAPRIS